MAMKQFAPAAHRNKDPILAVLRSVLDGAFGQNWSGLKLLELSSGSGQHALHLASNLPGLTVQPSEYDLQSVGSVREYVLEAHLTNLLLPLHIDVTQDPAEWPEGALGRCPWDVMLCINLVHISPWSCTQGLFRAAGQLLRPGGLLVTYGPYAFDGVIQPESNVRFDEGLRARDNSWGLRDVCALQQEAALRSLTHIATHAMPANNHTLVFVKN